MYQAVQVVRGLQVGVLEVTGRLQEDYRKTSGTTGTTG